MIDCLFLSAYSGRFDDQEMKMFLFFGLLGPVTLMVIIPLICHICDAYDDYKHR